MLKRFTSTLYFLKNINDTAVDPHVPLFAFDTNAKGSKKFFQCGYEYFIYTYYPILKDKHIYEVLRYESPTKLFFDVETTTNFEMFDTTVQLIIDHVYQRIGTHTTYILDSSDDSKKSCHIIFEYAFENMEQVKELVMEVKNSSGRFSIIDHTVYSRNRCFRLLGSSKKGSSRILRWKNKSIYEPLDVFKTMIQTVLSPSYMGLLAYDGCVRTIETRIREEPVICSTHVNMEDIPFRLVQYIERLGGTIRSVKMNEKSIEMIISGMYCPHAHRIHSSNNMYFTLYRNTLVSFFTCADVECSRIAFWRNQIHWILEP